MLLTLAITGGTGFVGGHALAHATARGHCVRALARKPQPPMQGVQWIAGSLTDPAALDALVAGADAIIHIAGVTNAATPDDFAAGNVLGTAFLRRAAGTLPFVHVSSLSAREPALSHYGWSKYQGEQVARGLPGPFVILRPPAVYGPGDSEFLHLFRLARSGLLPMPAGGTAAMLYGPDLAEALVALAEDLAGPAASAGQIFEIDDGAGGYPQHEIAGAIAAALGKPVRAIPLPAPLIHMAALADTAIARMAGRLPRLSRDRAGYMTHQDWSADSSAIIGLGLWHPRTRLQQGMARTAATYRNAGQL